MEIRFIRYCKIIKVETYNTEIKVYEKDMDSDFTIKFDWNWNERFHQLS